MYELAWKIPAGWAQERNGISAPSALGREDVERTMLLHWEEHCLECAAPACFSSCSLYSRRADGNCRRMEYGIYPNRAFSGLFNYGADMRFKRWAKLETILFAPTASVRGHRRMSRVNTALTRAVRMGAKVLRPFFPKRNLSDLRNHFRNRYLFHVPNANPVMDYDDFVVECYSPDPEPFRLMLDYRPDGISVFKHAFAIKPGHNFFTLPASKFKVSPNLANPLLTVFPENDLERRLIFTWLDFVKYRKGARPVARDGEGKTKSEAREKAAKQLKPAAKIKCVAWDLDNTLWKGTLIEDTAAKLACRDDAIALVKALDERGIIQTVVSKNNHDDAWAVIKANGLEDYFLYPAINWGQKSESLKKIADRLNINIDTFALIDDSPFERSEVTAALPMVRAYAETELAALLMLPEFDVPITEMSRARRQSYLVEIQRERAEETFGGDYEEFLRSCQMRLKIFAPTEPSQVKRCLELVQRSNQLNLSSRRYSEEEFGAMLKTPGILSLAFSVTDRFGDYGIVGFASVDEREGTPTLRDFVMSCRVAQKRVEHTFFQWLARREFGRGCASLRAELVMTDRNGPLRKVFEELPFKQICADGDTRLLEMPVSDQAASTVIAVESELGT